MTGAGAQKRLRQLCEPFSAWISPVQTSLCFSIILSPQVLNLVGLVQDLGKERCREAGDSRAQAGLGREVSSVPPALLTPQIL